MSKRSSALSVLTAGVLWGLISIFIKQLSSFGFNSVQIAFVRMLVASVIFTSFILIKDKSLMRIHLKDIWMFFGTGIISVALFNYCYFYTIINSEASLAVVLLYTSPVFVVAMSAMLFKEKITANKIAAVILTFIGCILVAGIAGGVKAKPIIVLTGILSGLFYALYSIFGRYALQKYSTYTVTAYTFIFGLFGVLWFSEPVKAFRIFSVNPQAILWCIGIGIVSTVLPYFFYTKGLENMESGKAAIIVAVEPLVGAVIGMVFYKESHSAAKIAGILLILLSIAILNTDFGRGKKNEGTDKPVNDVC